MQHGQEGMVVLDNIQGFYCSEKVESSSSHNSDLAKEWLSLTILHKVFFNDKVESSSSHGSDMAKEWLSLTIY